MAKAIDKYVKNRLCSKYIDNKSINVVASGNILFYKNKNKKLYTKWEIATLFIESNNSYAGGIICGHFKLCVPGSRNGI